MTPLVDRAIKSHRQFLRRTHGNQPAAFLINPKDDRALGTEFAWLRPQTQAQMPQVAPAEFCYKYIKGIAVYVDQRVPRGHVALLK